MKINNELIKDNADLRMDARNQLRGRWGTAVLLCFIFSIITSLLAIPYIGAILNFLLLGPLVLGLSSCFLKIVRNEVLKIENMFDGFKNFGSGFLLQLLMSLFIFLWTLLFIIPGIIAIYRYSMAFYILSDNPEIGAMAALDRSKEMMKGFKWKLFCMYLSFIGWALLCVLTAGIGLLWLIPYINTSIANFYENLKESMKPDLEAGEIKALTE
ncbi:DUF975 family protein [Clostridium sp. HMP27]|uniref:DUF975 family protein n=1 Tax=Clostridium sp. HMP27 TaxID=1487921 RepID=UPI00068F74B3|nr:DUF975 family protein [Clostridium sp. HMP27]